MHGTEWFYRHLSIRVYDNGFFLYLVLVSLLCSDVLLLFVWNTVTCLPKLNSCLWSNIMSNIRGQLFTFNRTNWQKNLKKRTSRNRHKSPLRYTQWENEMSNRGQKKKQLIFMKICFETKQKPIDSLKKAKVCKPKQYLKLPMTLKGKARWFPYCILSLMISLNLMCF